MEYRIFAVLGNVGQCEVAFTYKVPEVNQAAFTNYTLQIG